MAARRDGRVVSLSLVLSFFLVICSRLRLPGGAISNPKSLASPLESFASLGWRHFKPPHGSEWSCRDRRNTQTILSTRKYDNVSGLITGLLLLCGDISTHPGPFHGRPLASKRSFLNCLVSNARSIKSWHKTMDRFVCNLSRFQELVYAEDSDIIFVSETWLTSDVFNIEILPEDYFIVRNDRDTHGGGVLLAIKANSFKSAREIVIETDIEACFAEVTTCCNINICLCCCYRPPNSDSTWLDKFNSTLAQVCDRFNNILICGDFNYPYISWDHPERTRGADDLQFSELLGDYFLSQIVTSPTRDKNILDLVLTNVPDLVQLGSILQPEQAGLFTDHSVVTFSVKASVKRPRLPKRSVYDYRRGDFEGLRCALQSLNLSNILQDDGNVNLDWTRWKDTYLAAVADFVPLKNIRRKNGPPWLTGDILYLLRKKESVRKKLKSSPQNNLLREKFKNLRARTKQLIRESRANYFESMDIRRQPKRFWSIFRLTNKSSNFPEVMSMGSDNVNGRGEQLTTASTPKEIAQLFNCYFASVFSSSTTEIPPDESMQVTGPVLSDLEITTDEVLKSLKLLNVSKATGSDGIPARLLRETADEITPSLTKLFNKTLQYGVIPDDWKVANVVPVHKKGRKDCVENYRPISLLPLISKVLERCVLMRVRDHLYRLISPAQHGFLPGRSCVTQLLTVLDQIGEQLDAGKQTDIIYLDMSKAFDKVCHSLLLRKLKQFNVSGRLLDWFSAYLTNRKQRVTVSGESSKEVSVSSGVPQGSLLGPLLFLLFVNNLPATCNSSEVACFADDTKIYRLIDSVDDSRALQSDLNSLVDWSESSALQFNQQKCKSQRITRKRNPIKHQYLIKGSALDDTTEEKDLGVWISSDLSWSTQVHHQCNKANKLLGFVRRSSRYISKSSTRRAMYLALVRSHLGYATQVWSPQSIELIKCIERVQRRATKYILMLPFQTELSYKERLMQCSLLPISYWHEMLDLIFLYKATNGLINIDCDILPLPRKTTRATRSSHNNDITTYTTKKCRTVTYQRSFFIRTSRIWNSLPSSIRVNSLSLKSFKVKLFEYYMNALLNLYDPDNPRTWKSVCLKCNMARPLNCSITCCF